MFDSLFNRALKSGVEKGIFAQPKGMQSFLYYTQRALTLITGPSGGTKLAAKPKAAAAKPAAPKTEKKAPAPKKEKKEAAPKKAAAAAKPKKAATAAKPKAAAPKAKATKTEKKAPAAKKEKKEAAPKKAAAPKAKKAAAPKAVCCHSLLTSCIANAIQAPAVVDKPAVLSKTKSGRVTKTKTDAPKTKKAAASKKPAAKKAAPKKAAASAA